MVLLPVTDNSDEMRTGGRVQRSGAVQLKSPRSTFTLRPANLVVTDSLLEDPGPLDSRHRGIRLFSLVDANSLRERVS
jgi:hypothetical protein